MIKGMLSKIFESSYDKCYARMEYAGDAVFGCCGGLSGGTKNTDYLQESCINCPYLTLSTINDHKNEEV